MRKNSLYGRRKIASLWFTELKKLSKYKQDLLKVPLNFNTVPLLKGVIYIIGGVVLMLFSG